MGYSTLLAMTRPRRHRWLRLALRLVGAVGISVALIVLALLWLGAHLDSPGVKRKLLAQLASRLGLTVTYDTARLHFEGLELHGVQLASPPVDRAVAPNLASFERLDIKWGAFLRGGPLHITDFLLDGLRLDVVVDEHDESSLERLFPLAPPKNTPSTPLSQLVKGLLDVPVEVAAACVGPIHFALHQRHGQVEVGSESIDGLGAVMHGGHAGWSVELQAAPLDWTHAESASSPVHYLAGVHVMLTVRPKTNGALVRVQVGSTLQSAPLDAHGCFVALGHLPARRCAGASFLPHPLFELDATVDAQPTLHRTQIQVARLALIGDAASAELLADLYDGATDGDPLIERLHVGLDVEPLARLVPELIEGHGHATVDLEQLSYAWPNLHFLAHGRVAAGVRVASLTLHLGERQMAVDRLNIAAELHPAAPATATRAPLALVAKSELGKAVLTLPGTRVELAAHATEWRVDGLSLGGGQAPAVSFKGRLGDLTLTGGFGQLVARGIGLDGHAKLQKRVLAGALHLPIAEVSVSDPRRQPLLASGPLDLTVDAEHVELGQPNLKTSSGRGQIALRWAGITVAMHAERSPKATHSGAGEPLHVALDIAADDLSALGALMPLEQQKQLGLPLTKMQLSGSATADVDLPPRAPLAATLAAQLTLKNGALLVGRVPVTFDPLELHLTGRASPAASHAELRVAVPHLTVAKEAEPAVALTVIADYAKGKGQVKVAADGAGLTGHLSVTADEKKAHWHLASEAALTHVATLLDLAALPDSVYVHPDLTATFSGQGDLTAAQAGKSAELAGQIKLGLAHVDVELGDSEYLVPKIALEGTASSGSAGGRHLDAHVEVSHPSGDLPTLTLAMEELAMHVVIDQPALKSDVSLTLSAEGKKFEQSAFPLYVPSDLQLEVDLRGNLDDGRFVLDRAHLELPEAGGRVDLKGRIELGHLGGRGSGVPGRSSLGLSGRIEQQLDALGDPHGKRGTDWHGTGRVTIPLDLESGDLRVFRVAATVELHDASLAAGSLLAIDGISGAIPLVQSFVLSDTGVVRLGGAEVGAYPTLRFADQQPFLQSKHYLSIRSLRYGLHTVGPLEGNLRVDRNVVALEHVELAAFSGKITGLCLVDTNPDSPELLIRGDVTGVRLSKSAEPIDANWALRVAVGDRSVEGRAEIVRIDKRDLLTVLDAWDPYRTDTAANRMRKALAVGYPDRVRLSFHQGFASLALELGGLGKLFRVEPIEGLPIGPIIEKYLAPLLEPDDDDE